MSLREEEVCVYKFCFDFVSWLFGFLAIPGRAQRLLLTLYTGITPLGLGTIWMSAIQSRLATCKANALSYLLYYL